MKIPNVLKQVLFAVLAISATHLRGAEIVDVMILYTADVKSFYTDEDGVEAHANMVIESTNIGYANSGLDLQLRLVYLAETPYTESGSSLQIDLDNLSAGTNGLENVHDLRNAWGADLVCLFRDGNVGNNSGLANIDPVETGNDTQAFSVVEAESAISNFTFHHEIGHNYGAAHARTDPSGIDDTETPEGQRGGLFEYSNGYRFTAGSTEYRTIMAYAPGDRINNFSNPDVNHLGVPTGIAAGEVGAADNVSTFKITTPYISNYRSHMTEIPTFQPPISKNLSLVQGSQTILHINVVGVPELTLQWYNGLSGDTSNPITGETGTSYETGALTQTSYFWVRATNPIGATDSPTITISVTPNPTEPNVIDQGQTLIQTGYILQWDRTDENLIFDPYWQDFIPASSYTDSIEVRLGKGGGGNPTADILAQLFDPDGNLIYKQTITAAEISTSPGSYISLPVKMYLIPGYPYRVQVHATSALNPGNQVFFVWYAHTGYGNPYTEGNSNLDFSESYNTEEGFEGIDFTFRTFGSNASPLFTTIEPTSRTVASETITYPIDVTSNTDWIVAETLDWLSVSPTSGAGNGQVTVSVDENDTAAERSGFVNIGGIDHEVTQSLDPTSIALDLPSISVSAAATTYPVSVTTLGNWSASETENWLSITPSNGSGSGSFTVSVAANESSILRDAIVTVGSEMHAIRQFGDVSGQLEFDEWIHAYFDESQIVAMTPDSKTADSDNDGLDNYGEMTLRLDPTNEGETGRLTITQNDDTAVLVFEPYDSSLSYRLHKSSDLVEWTLVSSPTTSTTADSISFIVPLENGVTYRLSAVE